MKVMLILFFILTSTLPAIAYPIGMKALFSFQGEAVESISGDIGTVYGATLTEDRFGNTNAAYYFDGDDWIQFAHREEYNYDPTNNFTISLWVKVFDQTHSKYSTTSIVEKWTGHQTGSDVGYPYTIRYICDDDYATGEGAVTAGRFDPISRENPTIFSTTKINDGEFHNITFIKDGDYTKLYIDSVIQGAVLDTTTQNTNNSCDLYFARRGQDAPFDSIFSGVIDDFYIYDRALTYEEVKDIYEVVPTPEPSTFILLAVGLLGWAGLSWGKANAFK